jgi:Domain of unknown function (DUF4386)
MKPQRDARIAGFLYLIVIVGGAFAEAFVRGRLVVVGDAMTTAQHIQAHQALYRWGFIVELFYCLCNLPLILILYRLLRVVNYPVASMMLISSMLANAIESVSLIADFAPLILLSPGNVWSAFSTQQIGALAYLCVQLFEHGFAVSLIFFGVSCLMMAYLIMRSNFLPRILGLLLAFEGFGYLVNSLSLFFDPALQPKIFPYFATTALAEVALCLWLMAAGVNVEKWHATARLAPDR